ncbi:MAG: L-2-amino-thiazoline-4-carboxylic acid hydrolase [Candidatus Latescibacteria bacterium]|nr:L-2-amino-thiazoline-4-carboxylic acid hydrolase [Candidatus Latescibacterota bacterium]
MIKLNDKQISEYFHRNYTAVDGLWFMKVEEQFDFETALKIDNEVWKVLPKIQARMLKSMGNLGDDIVSLRESVETKLYLEGYEFDVEPNNDDGFKCIITECPWHNAMVKSGRTDLSSKVGKRICLTEYNTWLTEFDTPLRFEIEIRICEGEKQCVLNFFKEESKAK